MNMFTLVCLAVFALAVVGIVTFHFVALAHDRRASSAAPLVEGSWSWACAKLDSAVHDLYGVGLYCVGPVRPRLIYDVADAARDVLNAVPANDQPAQPIIDATVAVAQKISTTIDLLSARDGSHRFSDRKDRTVSDAADKVFAAVIKDLNRIGAEATDVTGRITQLGHLAQPSNSAVRSLDTWSLVVQELSLRGRAGASATVTALRGRINELTAADQTTVQHALTAICDASQTLAKIPEKQRNQPNNDGTTPTADAATVIDLATEAITAAAQAAVDGDVDQLRILRRYAQQWDPHHSLNLSEGPTAVASTQSPAHSFRGPHLPTMLRRAREGRRWTPSNLAREETY